MSLHSRRDPPPEPDKTSLYIGDLDKNVSKHELYEIFSKYGDIQEIKLPLKYTKPLGYAYINYKSAVDANRALSQLRHLKINAQQCRVMEYTKSDKTIANIYVKNLPLSVTNEILYNLFCKYGKILSSKVKMDPTTNTSLGYGYISFLNQNQAVYAIKKTNGMILNGHKLITESFISREQRLNNMQYRFTNIYVKHIPPSWNKQQIIDLFEDTTKGYITSHSIRHNAIGTSGCLNFDTEQHAKLAINRLNGYIIGKYTLYVARAQKRKERNFIKNQQQRQRQKHQKEFKLFVSNLPDYVDEYGLEEIFWDFGIITSSHIVRDDHGVSKQRGFIGFQRKYDASNAMYKMNGTWYDGLRLCITRERVMNNMRHYERKACVQKWKKADVEDELKLDMLQQEEDIKDEESLSEDNEIENSPYCNNDPYLTAAMAFFSNKEDQKKHDYGLEQKVEDEERINKDLEIWLRKIVKVPEYIGLFKKNGVEDLETVQLLTEKDLKEIGIQKIGHLKKILRYIDKLKENSNRIEGEGDDLE